MKPSTTVLSQHLWLTFHPDKTKKKQKKWKIQSKKLFKKHGVPSDES